MEQAKQKVREFLGNFFRSRVLADDDDIFASGFVNSLVVVQLINFIEAHFSVTIEDEDLEFANFRTLNQIVLLIERKNHSQVLSAGQN